MCRAENSKLECKARVSPCTKSVMLITMLWIRNTRSPASFPRTTACLFYLLSSFKENKIKYILSSAPAVACLSFSVQTSTRLPQFFLCFQRISNEPSHPVPSLRVAAGADLTQTTCRACLWRYWLYIQSAYSPRAFRGGWNHVGNVLFPLVRPQIEF